MRMPELKSLARERRLRGYSRMRKTELVALFQNSPPPAPRTRPPRPTRPPTPPLWMCPSVAPSRGATWEPIDDRRPRAHTQQEMDIFEQQEMSKSRPQVKGKLNKWYDWLINHVPKPIKDGASKAFKTFKDKVMGLYNRVTANFSIILLVSFCFHMHFSLLNYFVGSMKAPSKAFLLFFMLPDWLKLNHLNSRMECGFSDIFRAIFVLPEQKQ